MQPPTPPPTDEPSEDIAKLLVDIFDGDYELRKESEEKLSCHPNREAAIPIVMSRFRKMSMDDAKHRGQMWEITGVLGAVGTIAAVDPLLEIYEAVPKGRLDEYGDVLEEDKYDSEGQMYDTGFEPCHNLVRLDGGIEALRKKCNAQMTMSISLFVVKGLAPDMADAFEKAVIVVFATAGQDSALLSSDCDL